MSLSRRNFITALGVSAATTLAFPAIRANAASARVVVIGGGFGGATAARYLRRLDPNLQVTLVERDSQFVTCPFSNLVLGGLQGIDTITHSYDGLRGHGVEVIHDSATAIDATARKVSLAGGQILEFDRLIVAPGISLKFDAIDGYDQAAAEKMPHAWKAGPQTVLLRQQLEAMDDGGVVIIAPPGNPYRCPPGPYERASMIAHYLKENKPKSKILILDAKDKFSKQGLFTQGWEALYPGMIEWVAGSEGGIVQAVDADNRTLLTESGFTEHTGDVVNFIPPQQAAQIALDSGLADNTGWCPVDQHTFESTQLAGVHVLGDASIAGKMPKSGFSANSQAKVCAAAVVAALKGTALAEPSYANTCYSLVGPSYGISVSAVYRLNEGQIGSVEGAGGVSPTEVDGDFRVREASFARGWYASITADMFS
jgi:sulfide dehydrogenase [flavocytochrome c] flavoprotein subunit